MNSTGTSGECAGTQRVSPHYVWRVPGAPLQISISIELVRRIRGYLTAHSERSPNSEAGGLLLGKPRPSGVEIGDFTPLFHDDTPGPHFVFSDAEKPNLRSRIEEMNRLGSELSVVGYFRSDVREGISLYEDDLALIREFFSDHSNVFLIIRNAETPHPTAGFFFWDANCIFSSFSFMEFSFHESVLASALPAVNSAPVPDDDGKAGQQLAASVQVSAAGNGFKLDPAPVEELRNQAARHPLPSRRWVVGAGITVALGLGLGVYSLVARRVVSSPTIPQKVLARTGFQPASMGLAVSRSGTDMSIVWNGQAPLITGARVGMLTIEDGNSRHDLPLTRSDLLSSRLIYTPKSNTVRITLEIFAHDGKVTRENVIAVANAAAPMAAAGAPTAAAADARPNRVEVPVDKSARRSQPPSESQVTERNPPRDFVPPVARMESPRVVTPAEPPPAIAPRMDVPRMDLPGVQLAAAVPPPVRQDAPNSPSEKPPQPLQAISQPVQAISQPVLQPPVPLRQVRPVLPPNVKAMLTGRVNVKVRVQVDATGRVNAAEPLNTAGSLGRFLGSAAASAARTWTFEPATMAGRKVPGELTVEFIFVPER